MHAWMLSNSVDCKNNPLLRYVGYVGDLEFMFSVKGEKLLITPLELSCAKELPIAIAKVFLNYICSVKEYKILRGEV